MLTVPACRDRLPGFVPNHDWKTSIFRFKVNDMEPPNPVVNVDSRLRVWLEPAGSCADCGACCLLTPLPPFAPGECEQREIPREWLRAVEDRVAAGEQFEALPCVWFDAQQKQCRHYEQRPAACRDFLLGGPACASARRRLLSAQAAIEDQPAT